MAITESGSITSVTKRRLTTATRFSSSKTAAGTKGKAPEPPRSRSRPEAAKVPLIADSGNVALTPAPTPSA